MFSTLPLRFVKFSEGIYVESATSGYSNLLGKRLTHIGKYSVEEAINHINTYGSRHTDGIVTEDQQVADSFGNQVDAANVFHNCSTRFADGFRYGFGAEVGISTQQMPPRGPVGLEGLVTYKYKVTGNGHIAATYVGENAKPFTHRDI